MSVEIKNLEMPKTCNDCPFLKSTWDALNCILTGSSGGATFAQVKKERRMANCPLKDNEEKCNAESR